MCYLLCMQFYPFGLANNDSVLERTLDGSSPNITLLGNYTFFNQKATTLYVRKLYNACIIHTFSISQSCSKKQLLFTFESDLKNSTTMHSD